MAESFEAAVLKIQREKKWQKHFFVWIWGFILVTLLIDGFNIYWVARRFDLSLWEIVSADDFAFGGLFTVAHHPSYLVAASTRLRFLVFKLIVAVIFSGVFWDYFKCQDLALKLFESMPKGENGIKKPDG